MAILGPVEPGRGFDGATEGVRRGNPARGGDELLLGVGLWSTSVRDLAGQMGITGASRTTHSATSRRYIDKHWSIPSTKACTTESAALTSQYYSCFSCGTPILCISW